jgi:hypothetical protein
MTFLRRNIFSTLSGFQTLKGVTALGIEAAAFKALP